MALSTGILIFFIVAVLGSLLVYFKRGDFGQIKFSITADQSKGFVVAVLLICAFLVVRIFFSPQDALINVLIFAVSFTIPFVLKRANFSSELLMPLLLAFAVLTTTFLGSSLPTYASLAILLGLQVYKTLENFVFSNQSSFDDVIPACVWLAAISWIGLTNRAGANIENMLLSCISMSLLLKLIPVSLISTDKFFVKRLILSAVAGLGLLIILAKILLLSKMDTLALLYGAGIFFCLLFQNRSCSTSPDDQKLDKNIWQLSMATKYLVLLGILTLIATRIFGDLGIVILSGASVLCTGFNMVIFAGLFWLSRLLIQGFITANVSNITGINLMHSYCSAAQYFGFLASLFLSLLLYLPTETKKWLVPVAVLSICTFTPPALIYLIHEEPAASFLIAVNAASIGLVSFSMLIYGEQNFARFANLMLVPLMMSTISSLYAFLVPIGNQASVSNRIHIVSYTLGAVGIICIIFLLLNLSKKSQKPR